MDPIEEIRTRLRKYPHVTYESGGSSITQRRNHYDHARNWSQRKLLSYWLGRLWLWLFGWKICGEDSTYRKFVFIAAPHASNWDFPFMLATAYAMRVRISWFGKHTLFNPPWGWLLRKLGGIPVDRRAPQTLVMQMAEKFKNSDALVLAVPPEGTRSKVDV